MGRLARVAIGLTLVCQAGCPAEVETLAQGGGGATGAGGSGGAPGLSPICAGLEITGELAVVSSFGTDRTSLALSRENDVVISRMTDFFGPSQLTWFDAWSSWPPVLIAEAELEGEVALVTGANAGITTLRLDEVEVRLDFAPGVPTPPIPLPDERGVFMARVGEEYLVLTASDAGLSYLALSATGVAIYGEPLGGCDQLGSFWPTPAALTTSGGGRTLLAHGDRELPSDCEAPLSPVLWMHSLLDEGSEGLSGQHGLIDAASDEHSLSSIALLDSAEGPLLVFGRYSEGSPQQTMETSLYAVHLVDGFPDGAPKALALGAARPTDQVAVLPLAGGFAVASLVMSGYDTYAVWVGLYDGNADLVEELITDVPVWVHREGIRGVVDPGGSGFLLAWASRTGDEYLDNAQMMLRVGCVP